MKASELRIGNIVQSVYNDTFGISQETLCDFANGYVNLKPIPLTQEWLINFGFENKPDIDNGTYHTTVFEKDGVALLFFMGNFDECSINGDLEFDFTYVHTLQNFWHLFRKQELKIK